MRLKQNQKEKKKKNNKKKILMKYYKKWDVIKIFIFNISKLNLKIR